MTSPSPTDSTPASSEEQPPSRGQWVRGVLGPLAGAGILVALLWPHLGKIGEAIELVSWQASPRSRRSTCWRSCCVPRPGGAALPPPERPGATTPALHERAAVPGRHDRAHVPGCVGTHRAGEAAAPPSSVAADPHRGPDDHCGRPDACGRGRDHRRLVTAAVLTSSLEWWWIAAFAAAVLLLGLICGWCSRALPTANSRKRCGC